MEVGDQATHGPFGLASVVLGLALLIAGESLGWPARDDVLEVFERHDAEDESIGVVELRLRVTGADPAHVDATLGAPLSSHLESVYQLVPWRLAAVDRAHQMYTRAVADREEEPRVTGLGLLVLQRAALAVEDLGGVLYALTGPNMWERLVSYRVPDLDHLFRAAAQRELDARPLYCLPDDRELAEHASSARLTALTRLRDLTLEDLQTKLQYVGAYWMAFRPVAKATMHGFALVAAQHLLEPPGAGELSELGNLDRTRPFAVALISEEQRDNRIHTVWHPIDLTPPTIDEMVRTSKVAADLLLTLASFRLKALREKLTILVPMTHAHHLTQEERDALATET